MIEWFSMLWWGYKALIAIAVSPLLFVGLGLLLACLDFELAKPEPGTGSLKHLFQLGAGASAIFGVLLGSFALFYYGLKWPYGLSCCLAACCLIGGFVALFALAAWGDRKP